MVTSNKIEGGVGGHALDFTTISTTVNDEQ
jgi:hypothetical protein